MEVVERGVVVDLQGVLPGRQLAPFELDSVRIKELDRVVVLDVTRQDRERGRA